MRSRFRIVTVALLATFAVSAIAVSAASAEVGPEFLNNKKAEVVKKGFTGKVGVTRLKVGATVQFECKVGQIQGEISGKTKVMKVFETFTGCTASGGACSVHTPGAAEGEIKMNELEGELGHVAKAEASSERGLILFPKGKKGAFALIEGIPAECSRTFQITGSVIGEVTPVKKLQRTSLITYAEGSNGAQKIQKFEGKEKNTLLAFGAAASMTMADELKFEEEVEVT
jgi:carbon monoxide dehydrogenase subunit G